MNLIKEYKDIVKWLDRHREEILSIPNVLGVGVGKISGEHYGVIVNVRRGTKVDFPAFMEEVKSKIIYGDTIKPLK